MLYKYHPYLKQVDQHHREQYGNSCEVIGTVNTVQMADMVVCEIFKRYLRETTSQVLNHLDSILKENPDRDFRIKEMQKYDVPVINLHQMKPNLSW